jgi:hypothetical protein
LSVNVTDLAAIGLAVLLFVKTAETVVASAKSPVAGLTVSVVGGNDDSTVTGALSPVGAIATVPASPPALFVYVPGVLDAVTLKCNVTSPPAER